MVFLVYELVAVQTVGSKGCLVIVAHQSEHGKLLVAPASLRHLAAECRTPVLV
jgi:hypothetical protein